jgi:membrane associated rhomboid family serine protease
MNNPLKTIFTLPKGMLLFLGIYAVSFPIAYFETKLTGQSVLLQWLGLQPLLVWKGEVWRVLTFELVSASVLGWAINLFWLATLVNILRNDWTSLRFWIFCLISAIGGAIPLLFIFHEIEFRVPVTGAGAVVCALLFAWDRFYHRERIMMLGLGEVSVRQAAWFIIGLNAVITFFSCGGWQFTLSMFCGGALGWLFLMIGNKRVMSRGSRVVESQRVARLEL